MQLCIKHFKVAASAGDQVSMDHLMQMYRDKLLTKEELAQTLREFQTSNDATKSNVRDLARLLDEARKKGEDLPFHLFTEGLNDADV